MDSSLLPLTLKPGPFFVQMKTRSQDLNKSGLRLSAENASVAAADS